MCQEGEILTHYWESSGGIVCPMKKRNKCIFAHGVMELRLKENRRDRWGNYQSSDAKISLSFSGGEDAVLAAQTAELKPPAPLLPHFYGHESQHSYTYSYSR